MTEKQFYVYIHCRPDETPFYVGKGSGNRHKVTGKRNAHYRNIVNKYGEYAIIKHQYNCKSEVEALLLEIKFIAQFREQGYVLAKSKGTYGISISLTVKCRCVTRSLCTQNLTPSYLNRN